MNSPVVERVARQFFQTRHGRRSSTWELLKEQSRQGYRELVEEVLMAAMNAGLLIREFSPAELEAKKAMTP
jgi:hypothetical protein